MDKKTGKLIILILLLTTMLAFSGCISGEINTKVNKDLSGMRSIDLEMTSAAYNYLSDALARENFEDDGGRTLIAYDKKEENGQIYMHIVMEFDNLNQLSTMDLHKDGNYLIFEDSLLGGEINDQANNAKIISLVYTVEMPGEIVDSNANEVVGKKAIWNDNFPETTYVKSKVPSIPGFSIFSSLIVGLLGFIILKRKGNNIVGPRK